MIKGASAKGSRTMTNATILIGWHVVERFSARINAMAGCAIIHDVGMVNECTGEGIGVMAGSTVIRGGRVSGYRRSLSGCVDTITVIVARVTGLYRWVNQAVIENATKTKGHNAMAYAAIDIGERVACRWIGRLVSCGNPVAGVAAVSHNDRVGVVRVGR